MPELFGKVVNLSKPRVASRSCACELEDGDGCVGECYDDCDCACESYSTVDGD